jgi:pimeloyl-ACP methyl ester carboxylesterase
MPVPVKSSTFVLVHGSFLGASAWDDVKIQLEKKGQQVIVVELPAHGNDTTNLSEVSMTSYRDKVVAAINTAKGTVILIGHSMGGMVISAVAEAVPVHIEKLVYLSAFVPQNGQSLLDLASKDTESVLRPLLVPSPDFLQLNISDVTKIPDVFCADGSSQIKQMLLDKYKPEPAVPLNDHVALTTAAFGSVDKYYIHTLNDHVLGITLQKKMVADAGIKKVYSLNSSHCPQLSIPVNLTDLFMELL